ncbi:hypothetical protein S2091_3497 [Solimicrobium silvestre]|uniref:Uncharacterized protein n=1 Tax=Solimicrobium silvestre TaxID=2099400 RepID=A0A2S9GVJ3_9BURK|nr:hypothetical protein S2091_3497 [Solimicrobium silvestre]
MIPKPSPLSLLWYEVAIICSWLSLQGTYKIKRRLCANALIG